MKALFDVRNSAFGLSLNRRILKERGQLARRSLRRRLGLTHSYKVNSSAPSAHLGDLPARHSPQDVGGYTFAVQNSFLSLNLQELWIALISAAITGQIGIRIS